MVERIADMREGTLGLRVPGRIERPDYEEVLAPELRAAVDAGRVRGLVVVEGVAGIEPAALWADLKLFFEVAVGRRRAAWERTAIVTDIGWMTSVTRAVVGVIPGAGACVPTVSARHREGVGGERRRIAARPAWRSAPAAAGTLAKAGAAGGCSSLVIGRDPPRFPGR
jgi:hypothetical protein